MQTQATANFTGRTEETSLTIRFSDMVGASLLLLSTVLITNGDGDVIVDFVSSGLELNWWLINAASSRKSNRSFSNGRSFSWHC